MFNNLIKEYNNLIEIGRWKNLSKPRKDRIKQLLYLFNSQYLQEWKELQRIKELEKLKIIEKEKETINLKEKEIIKNNKKVLNYLKDKKDLNDYENNILFLIENNYDVSNWKYHNQLNKYSKGGSHYYYNAVGNTARISNHDANPDHGFISYDLRI